MSKRLPYFQFEPAEYLAGDIMFCSYGAQGVFNIIQSVYWQKDCQLTLEQAKRRCIGAEEFIEELIKENILKIDKNNIVIHFLDTQYEEALSKSERNSESGKKSAKLKKLRKEINKSIDYILSNSNEDLTEFQRNFNERSTDVDYLLQRKSTIKIIEDNIRENKGEKGDEVKDEVKNGSLHNVDKIINYYITDERLCNAVITNKDNRLKDLSHLKKRLQDFKVNLSEKGRESETWKEFSSYFLNWNKKTIGIKQKSDNPVHNVTF